MKKTILVLAVLAVFAAVVGAGCIGADPIVGDWKAGNIPGNLQRRWNRIF